ncbi:ABC transporter permease [Pelagibacterium xiamenense]|uniref:ABC transporter permease n=1 Tax=Pelagibacterium xiamenense TaxID=2901140 RepID=UPI001E4AACEC|nr:ABC transporter permease [Pelagibacterium xiamenense]MCD7059878.1 ABC transporter permease [Pelagibacterium xiamenense]
MAVTTHVPVAAEPEASAERRAPTGRESQVRMTWRRFKQHQLAFVSLWIVVLFYLVAVFAEFIAPMDASTYNPRYTYAPPQGIHFVAVDPDGSWHFGPYVNGYKTEIDPEALRRVFTIDPEVRHPLGFFVESEPYRLLGFIPMQHKLFGTVEPDAPLYVIGADRLGRDQLSRLIHGTRISLSIGLVGVVLSLVFGVIIGGFSGYYGGWFDGAVQRVIEFIRSLPTIPLWLGLAAALPRDWGPLQTYFAITLILSLLGWTELARVVRGRFLALRTEDFVTAAQLDGASDYRIIVRHMVPSFMSHIIAATTLAIPGMILAETALSFLGLGLQAPIVSWGTLLQDAQNIRTLAGAPWLLSPGIVVVVAILAMNFLGDGLRDAADPYGR